MNTRATIFFRMLLESLQKRPIFKSKKNQTFLQLYRRLSISEFCKVLKKNLITFALSLQLMLANPFAWAQENVPREFEIKAVFLFNFAKFIEWPSSSFDSSDSPINLCILGDNPFGTTLDMVVSEEKAQGRVAEVIHLNSVKQSSQCHIVFISRSETGNESMLLAALKNHPILTVSDIKDFSVHGGMIEFHVKDNRIRFIIDPDKIKSENLQVNVNLIRVGDLKK